MDSNVSQPARVVKVCYETNRVVVIFEGVPPEIGDFVFWVRGEHPWNPSTTSPTEKP